MIPSPRRDAAVRAGLIAFALAWAIAHVAAIFTEQANWDEFALLSRVERMLATGRIQGGGRPGAIELLLSPIVRGCEDAITTLRRARVVTAAATLFAILGVYELVRRLNTGSKYAVRGALLAAALWALALPFQRWSIQVRTDQFGVLFGVWGAVALLATRSGRPAWWAALAGVCFGAGFLFTQKVLYVALLAGIVRLGHAPPGSRSERIAVAREAIACTAVFALTVAGARALLSAFFTLPPLQRIDSGLRIFEDYRRIFGFDLYRGLLGAIVPHLLAIALLVAASVGAVRARSWQRRLTTAWAVLLAGVAVAWFHRGTFPYFWLTLGLFPAVALGCSCELLVRTLPARVRRTTIALWSLGLLLPAAVYSTELLEDTQHLQRESLRFAARELGPPRQGFQLEGALICRREPDPFQVYFRPHIEKAFAEPGAPAKIQAFIARFRTKPVHFLIDSHMIGFFPPEVTRFWQENYQAYRGPVALVGRALEADERVRWDVFAPGVYRWSAGDPAHAAELLVDGRSLRDGQTIELKRGRCELQARGGAGRLVYAVRSGPWHTADSFYRYPPIREVIGGSYFAP